MGNRNFTLFTRAEAAVVMELRSLRSMNCIGVNVSQAYTVAGKTPPTFTGTSLIGTMVKAAQITELRNAVLALE